MLAIEARESPTRSAKRACVMVAGAHVLPRYLSDLAGVDPAAHNDDPHEVIQIVRDHLHTSPQGQALPGAAHMIALYEKFRRDVPFLAGQARLTVEEVHARLAYRNFMDLLRGFCAAMPGVASRFGG